MPQAILRFERLAYLSIVLGVSPIFISLHRGLDAFLTLVAVLIGAAYLIPAALTFAAARRRQNWARWVYSILIVLSIAWGVVREFRFGVFVFDLATLLDAASDVAAIASVHFVFSRPSNSWFQASATADRPN